MKHKIRKIKERFLRFKGDDISNELMSLLIKQSKIKLDTNIPDDIVKNIVYSDSIIGKVKKIYKTHDDVYFNTSLHRYKYYFAIAKRLPYSSEILEVGGSPGHVTVGLYEMGFKLHSINLNIEWNKFYPSNKWLEKLNVKIHNIEKSRLPYSDNRFDAIFFTEVLEHIAIKDPIEILREFNRVLKPGGMIVISTPNVCNISNIIALLNGKNIFWRNEIFYGSLDRHNREYTPDELRELVKIENFNDIEMFGINCDSNWKEGTEKKIEKILIKFGDNAAILRNTIIIVAKK